MFKQDDISYEKIFEYIKVFNEKTDELEELRKNSLENNVPIIKDDVKSFLRVYLSIAKPKKILEIGTAVGYSSIFFALNSNATVDTIEKSEEMFAKATENIKSFDLEARVRVHLGEATEVLQTIDEKYDFVFIDAAKSHYNEFYALTKEKLTENGTTIFDNILYRGFVCVDKMEVPRRKRTIYTWLNEFLDNIKVTEDKYTMLPLGDGLLVISK
ncbi:O-methyltransferase [Criibacterium bergeronii]|uniref:O-methyltransferase n=1 Tax=Criibacterium bergeronii TaxID=1871336 RepID=A0A371IMF9_9FIRM|nr:O-methyltransferase [Criibacterium bergeronii]MBS6062301.1 O-methyltransferase [Peptostreptococcaceae bacterium]RDY21651.1 O-methyltransferase [Criibacterium bergeronii]TRW28560.1 O-methyltransferase [Criibacterium bergeronii]